MSLSFDDFTDSFLAKISEYDMLEIPILSREEIVDNYLVRTLAEARLQKIIKTNLLDYMDRENRVFNVNYSEGEALSIIELVTSGMVVQWIKPYYYKQEQLQNAITTRDFSVYSPAELLLRIGGAYSKAQRDYVNSIHSYSYMKADLSRLHL